MWAAGDRCINAFDPATGQRLLSLPDQESFVKQLLPGGWVTWVVTFACIKAVTARATGDQLAGQVRRGVLGRSVGARGKVWGSVAL